MTLARARQPHLLASSRRTPRAGPGSNARSPPNRSKSAAAARTVCFAPGGHWLPRPRDRGTPHSRSSAPTWASRTRPPRACRSTSRRRRQAQRDPELDVCVPLADRTDRPDGRRWRRHQRVDQSRLGPPGIADQHGCVADQPGSKAVPIAVVVTTGMSSCRNRSASRRDRPGRTGQTQQRFRCRRSGCPPRCVDQPVAGAADRPATRRSPSGRRWPR